jgi:hypothetical protein
MQQKTSFQLVCDFNTTFDFPVFTPESNPLETQQKVMQYRCDLIKEEGIEEFGKALSEDNRVEMLDAVVDHLYVLYGACHTLFMDPDYHIRISYSPDIYYDLKENTIDILHKHFNENKPIERLHDEIIYLYNNLVDSMLIKKDIFYTYSLLMKLIINTHFIGFHLTDNLKGAFQNVHESNMSKLCTSIIEANNTVNSYIDKYNNNLSPYDSPYYYQLKPNLYVVKNRSTGKALKSICYIPASLEQFLKVVEEFIY